MNSPGSPVGHGAHPSDGDNRRVALAGGAAIRAGRARHRLTLSDACQHRVHIPRRSGGV